MDETKRKLYLIDGHGLIYRAHFAMINNPLFTSKGICTSAVLGFMTMLNRLLKDEAPEYVAVALDAKGKTFRHRLYDKYKANRPPTPPEIIQQVPYIKNILKAMNIPMYEKEGFEADDILATMSEKAIAKGFDVVIVSADKDIYQLVSEKVSVLSPQKGVSDMFLYNPETFEEKYGFAPHYMIDNLSLQGDSSDNVPGVPSVGKVTARKLINQYGHIESLLEKVESIPQQKLRENIIQNQETLYLSKKLVTLDKSVPLEFDFDEMIKEDVDADSLRELFQELEFKELMKQLVPATVQEKLYHCIDSEEGFNRLVEELSQQKIIAVDLETTDLNPFKAAIVGIAFCFKPLEAYYIPVGHVFEMERQLDAKETLNRLKPVLESESIRKTGHNIKYDWEVFEQHGISLGGVQDDTMVAAYLVKPERRRNNLDDLTYEYLMEDKTPTEALIGKGAKAITMDKVMIDVVCNYACEDVDTCFRLGKIFRKELTEMDQMPLYNDIEIPLIPVLMRMEKEGIKIDRPFLENLEREYKEKLNTLENDIYAEADEQFNINSPKQLSTILFDKLQYPTKGIKKTTLGYSTNEATLQKLIMPNLGYVQFPQLLLDYRSLSKLLNTYVIALMNIADPQTDRIHTSFNQTVAETGRLSSSDPNLQNIPIRTEMGREIRKAFIPENDDRVILSADYSQVELRLLAHVSQDESMMKAFMEGRDIHAHTASEIFHIPLDQVTQDHRRMAKTINFGIDYGMTEWGLSARLHIPVNQARDYINNYLNRYAGVREYIEKTKESARVDGYVKTLFNRRRYLPEINSSRRNLRESAERQAINMPIQGTAAELIKIAMIRIDSLIREKQLKTRMLIQVHDELVFEVPKNEIDEVSQLIRKTMEEAVSLSIPIVVDMAWGENWLVAH